MIIVFYLWNSVGNLTRDGQEVAPNLHEIKDNAFGYYYASRWFD